jgi:hypothetical protein
MRYFRRSARYEARYGKPPSPKRNAHRLPADSAPSLPTACCPATRTDNVLGQPRCQVGLRGGPQLVPQSRPAGQARAFDHSLQLLPQVKGLPEPFLRLSHRGPLSQLMEDVDAAFRRGVEHRFQVNPNLRQQGNQAKIFAMPSRFRAGYPQPVAFPVNAVPSHRKRFRRYTHTEEARTCQEQPPFGIRGLLADKPFDPFDRDVSLPRWIGRAGTLDARERVAGMISCRTASAKIEHA